MTPFLSQVATAYLSNEPASLSGYCFVLPGKRAATFLSKHFAELTAQSDSALLQPAITTISDLVMDSTPWVETSRMELLFMMYNVYRDVVMKRYGDSSSLTDEQRARMADAVDFDKFQYWGEVLISDFNDVDKYLVDAKALFHNVEALKEIGSNHLSDEQMELLSRYFSDDHLPERSESFWRHTSRGGLSSRFVKLWQVLYPVYQGLRGRLAAEGKCYPGMAYRQLIDDLKSSRGDNMPYRRYIFVGFNVLSASEHKLFELLQRFGKADFYWDYQSPTFRWANNRAGRFLDRYVKEFKSLYPVAVEPLTTFPRIDIISVPSTIGQTKAIGRILAKLYPASADAPFNRQDKPRSRRRISELETAVVLPDEHLAIPVLHSLPPSVATANVTMGYPLRNTSVASFVNKVIALQLRARKLRSQDTFYYEDVLNVLTHPLVIERHGELCSNLIRLITQRNLFNVPARLIHGHQWAPLHPIFEIVNNLNDSEAVLDYLDRLMSFIESSVNEGRGVTPRDSGTEEVDKSIPIQLAFIECYRAGLDTLRELTRKYLADKNIMMADRTAFHLAQRMVSGETVPLEGMPLEGLQIMGVLETRALDFDNIIMPSMNERIFPRKHYQKSFIPNSLRRGYGMSTLDHQESIFAYYFYRLITRAKRVYLLYDGRSSGTRNGHCSRYISQLEYLFDVNNVARYVTSFDYVRPDDPTRITIAKDDRLRAIIRQYLPGAENPKYLSASSINKFIDCPLKFCLSELEGFGEPDAVKDYIDEGTLGSIVHRVFERMYNDVKGNRPEVTITSDIIGRLHNDALINRYITHAINEIFNHMGEGCDAPLSAESALLAGVLGRMVKRVLEREPVPFVYIDSEWRRRGVLKISGTLSINFVQSIDRIDRIKLDDGTERLRVVDYKTGADKAVLRSWDEAFDPAGNNRSKVMVQLFLYCNGYAQLHDGDKFTGAIKPQMYQLRTINSTDHKDCTAPSKTEFFKNGKPKSTGITDYRDYNDEFLATLEARLAPLFDDSTPFVAAETDHACKYCQFIDLCNRRSGNY